MKYWQNFLKYADKTSPRACGAWIEKTCSFWLLILLRVAPRLRGVD